jgi:DNA topoisomerase-3
MIPELRAVAGHVARRLRDTKKAAEYVQGLSELPLGRIVSDAKVTDHHAIIPTNAPHDADLSPDESRIYEMVARRFLAAFHPEAVFENTTLTTEVAGEPFRSRGRVMLEAGWKAVYGASVVEERPEGSGDDAEAEAGPDQELPPLAEGERVECASADDSAHETKPPPRYGEAALLAAMEGAGKFIEDDELRDAIKESGIGTPATRAAIIERLIDVGYVVREGRSLVPTQKAMQVIDLLDSHELTSPELTGRWEQRLLEIEQGKGSREDFMRDIAQFAGRTVEYLRDLPPERTRFQPRQLGIRCPRCVVRGDDGMLIERRANFGCSTWKSSDEPGCGFVVWKTIAGKHLTEDILRTLLEEGRTKELAGFRSKAGKPFRAMLVLDREAVAGDGTRFVSFEFAPRPARGRGGRAGDEQAAAASETPAS